MVCKSPVTQLFNHVQFAPHETSIRARLESKQSVYRAAGGQDDHVNHFWHATIAAVLGHLVAIRHYKHL